MKRNKKVTTSEDWYPTADDGTVTVSMHRDCKKTATGWRISIWGEDDYGLERHSLNIIEAYDLFRSIRDGVTKRWLSGQGFIQA
jgi:hypothetical protein